MLPDCVKTPNPRKKKTPAKSASASSRVLSHKHVYKVLHYFETRQQNIKQFVDFFSCPKCGIGKKKTAGIESDVIWQPF